MLWKIFFFLSSLGVLDILSTFDANNHFSDSRTHFAAAVFQQDVDVFLVLEMVIKVHNVFMVQYSVQLDLSVNLAGTKTEEPQLLLGVISSEWWISDDHGCCALTFSRW